MSTAVTWIDLALTEDYLNLESAPVILGDVGIGRTTLHAGGNI